jgi:hypothetical protein
MRQYRDPAVSHVWFREAASGVKQLARQASQAASDRASGYTWPMPIHREKAAFSARMAMLLWICALIAMLWPASYFWSDGLRIRGRDHRVELTTGPGWIAFTYGNNSPASSQQPRFYNSFITIDAGHRSALAYTRIFSSPGDYRFYFPLWMLSMSAGLIAAAGIVSELRKRSTFRPGCCTRCGYDLRASPDRCPECGAARSA